jgi:hypothetical protein
LFVTWKLINYRTQFTLKVGNLHGHSKVTAVNVDEFINQRAADGKLESEGSFAVDSLAALRKTLSSALPEPHYYLFQLLQGLVEAGAGDIKVAIGRRENRISFSDPNKRFTDLEALAATFNQGLSVSSNDPLDLVMTGLTTALGDHINKAEFIYDMEHVTVTADGVEHSTATRASSPHIVLRRVVEKGLSFSWSRIWGARKEEFRVRKRFEHSPISISIAGLPTEPHSTWRRGEQEGQFALLEVAVFDGQNHRGEPLGETQPVESSKWLRRCGTAHKKAEGTDLAIAPNLFAAALEGDQPVPSDELDCKWDTRQWTFCFTSHVEEPTEILFVRNGCNLATYPIDLGVSGLQIVAPADDLLVDASGYQIVDNEAFQARISEAKEFVQKLIELLRAEDLRQAVAAGDDDPDEVLGRFDWL